MYQICQHFPLFTPYFLTNYRQILIIPCKMNAFGIGLSVRPYICPSVYKILVSVKSAGGGIESSPKQALVLMCLQNKSLKTLREKEKLLVTSNFSFSYRVFYPFGELSSIFIKIKIVLCKLFQFGRVKNLSLGKGLITVLI